MAAVLIAAAPAQAAFPGTNGRIAFNALRGSNPTHVFVMNADGSAQADVSNNHASETTPVWSPDGTKLAMASNRQDARQEIYIMDPDGGNAVSITQADTVAATDPAWSPDGKQLAFQSIRQGKNQILVINADGTGEHQVTTGLNNDVHPAWSPDGTRIAFSSARAGNTDVYAIKPDGSGETRLTTDSGADFLPDWSPDGTRITFSSTRGNTDRIFVMNADGSNQSPITTSGMDFGSVFSPDGEKIAFQSFRDGTNEIYTMNADGSNQKRLTDTGSNGDADWGNGGCDDADGDALCDVWETNGLDVDNDGTVDVDLPAMGAKPDHKDIFVEFDAMQAHELDPAALSIVIQSFADSPDPNPDGTTGITLHVDAGPAAVMDPVAGKAWGALSESDEIPHVDVLGSEDGAGEYDWTAFDALKAAHFSDDRAPVFHYAIGAHQFGSKNQFAAGISRGFVASDFLLSLGTCQLPGIPDCNSDREGQAGTFMHELGHNLGLQHGGADGINRKPTYLSIMNYDFLHGVPKLDGTRRFDFSRVSLSVDEHHLDESHGFGAPLGSDAAAFRTTYRCPRTTLTAKLLDGFVDFNCNKVVDPPGPADINDDGRLSVLSGQLDWPVLVFSGGSIGSLAPPLAPRTTEQVEPPVSEPQAVDALLASGDTPSPSLPSLPSPAPVVTTPAPPSPPRCTLTRPPGKVAVKGAKRGRVTVVARCDASATLVLRGTISIPRGKHKPRKLALKAVHAKAVAGIPRKLTVRLPKLALRAISGHKRTALMLTLRASSAGGTTTTSTKRARLGPARS